MGKGLLTLDLATITGWAYLGSPSDKPMSGTHKIAPADKSDAGFFIEFEKFIDDLLTLHNPHTVVFEAPFMGSIKNLNTARRLIGFAVLTELVSAKKGVSRIKEVNNSTVKKFFTGNGRAEKKDMIFKCHQKGWKPKDDNEADALAILAFSMSTIMGVEI